MGVRAAWEAAGRGDVIDSVLRHTLFLLLADCLIAALTYLGAWLVRVSFELPLTDNLLPQERISAVAHPWMALIVSQVLLLYLLGLYDELHSVRYREIVTLSLAAALMQMAFITSLFYFTEQVFPRTVILLFDTFNFMALAAWRVFLKSRTRSRVRRTILVGERFSAVDEVLGDIEASPWMGLKVVGLVLKGTEPDPEESKYPVLGSLEELDLIIERFEVQDIIFASGPSWRDQVLDTLSEIQERRRVGIAILPSVYDMVIGKLRHVNIHDTPLIEVKTHPDEPFERFVKRTFDLVGAALALVLLAPVMLVLWALTRLLSPGPALYRQQRVGRGGKIFELIKFRTMVPDAEKETGAVLAREDDPRVTSWGRFLRRSRLDELPQLLNVLKGEMSFVGPRPERPNFVADFERVVPGYAARHKVKPGITGLAQVRGYYDTRAENKLRYDLAYIYNYGFTLDLIILLETLKVVIARRGL